MPKPGIPSSRPPTRRSFSVGGPERKRATPVGRRATRIGSGGGTPECSRLASVRRGQGVLVALLTIAALAVAATRYDSTPRWTPDSLFYEAQSLELAGTP